MIVMIEVNISKKLKSKQFKKLEKISKLALRSDFDYKFRQIVEYQESDFLYQMKIKYIAQSEKQPEVQNEYNFFISQYGFFS